MMMKKLLFVLFISFTGITMVSAQCTPDPLVNAPGIYPDSATNLPHATVGVPYSTTMTACVPHDTLGLTFDSVGVTSITGLPTGFSYTPNSASGYWHGAAVAGTVNKGCILISGPAPTAGQAGTYPLTIHVNAVVFHTQNPYTLTYYKIVIDPASSVSELIPSNLVIYQNSPNPFSDKTDISFSSPVKSNYNFTVSDMIGKVVYSEVFSAKEGRNVITFSADDLRPGLYLYRLSNGKECITKKMTVYK
jgi:hypothetical protein